MTDELKNTLRKTTARRKRIAERIVRTVSVVLLIALCFYIASRAAAPYLVSSNLVRSAMERAVAEWTGHEVTLGGAPEIEFWPEPRIALNAVTISKASPEGARILGRIERLSASFGLFDAVRGHPEFRQFRFTRPRFYIDRDLRGHLDWASEGLLSSAVRKVQALGEDRQTLDSAVDARVGSVTIEDGTVELHDQTSGRNFVLKGILADISWPRLSQELTAYVTLRIGDHQAKLDFSSSQPLLLFGGQDAAMRVSWQSTALSGAFDGTANLAGEHFISGSLNAKITDVPALITWTGARLPGLEALKEVSLAAELTKVGNDLRFDGLELNINDSQATGIVELSPPVGGRRRLSGTLAFDQMNITRLLGAFSYDLSATGQENENGLNGPLRWLDFDLSLSAAKASLPPFELRNVAASVLATRDKAQFDIADGLLESGHIQARLDSDGKGFESGGNLQLSVRKADLSAIIDRLKLQGPLPTGLGSLDLTLHTDRPIWSTGLADVEGTIRFTAQDGVLRGVNTKSIGKLSGERAYFRLSEAGDGSLEFRNLELSARFAAGSAEIEKAELTGAGQKLTISGIVPYSSNSLALLAELSPLDEGSRETSFPPVFIGGSWPDPVISPMWRPTAKTTE